MVGGNKLTKVYVMNVPPPQLCEILPRCKYVSNIQFMINMHGDPTET